VINPYPKISFVDFNHTVPTFLRRPYNRGWECPEFTGVLRKHVEGESRLSGQWYQRSNESLEQAANALTTAWHALAKPERARRVRQLIVLFLLVWAVFALAEIVWSFFPRSTVVFPSENSMLNPIKSRSGGAAAESVDLEAMLSWHLFGVAGQEAPVQEALVVPVASDRDGIEKGARDTRLNLKLRGIIAATGDGLGYAIIEHKSKQDVYAVGDKLPVGNRVTLAKVIPGSVVLDNGGTYELLRLFEETGLLGQLPSEQLKTAAVTQAAIDARGGGGQKAEIGTSIRQQLYDNPQSLAEVVRVSAVREDNTLKGYRIDPGKSAEQFTGLGFKAGDVVTSVNGINLDDPGNTMQLYQLMRSASEAVFDLERAGQSLTLTVNLN
jgi:general secretion pathway protein C